MCGIIEIESIRYNNNKVNVSNADFLGIKVLILFMDHLFRGLKAPVGVLVPEHKLTDPTHIQLTN